MLVVQSKGKELIYTNYWESEMAHAGYFFVTANAGCLRVLVPQMHEESIEEMRTGKRVLIEPSIYEPRVALDFVFDDGTETPFTVSISKEMMDRKLQPGRCTVVVLSQNGKQLELGGFANI